MSDTPIDYSDVQGTVLRGYRVDLARHFILKITDSAAAKRLIGSMVGTLTGKLILACKPAGCRPDTLFNPERIGSWPTRALVIAAPPRDDLVDLRELQRHRVLVG